MLSLWLRNRRGRRLTGDEARRLTRIIGSLADAEAVRSGIEGLVEDVLEGGVLAPEVNTYI